SSGAKAPTAGPGTHVAERFLKEHREFAPELQRIRSVADRMDALPPEELRTELEAVRVFLCDRLPLHEEEEEAAVYPVVASLLGGEDPMSSMARAHVEISHLVRVYQQLLSEMLPEGPDSDDLVDLRRVLYGLHAILRLHFAQEDEAYAWLSAEEPVSVG
ncbi:MAG TPA: hemerythrin domain-containing protein, partial [Actinomycetota bacterium]|nr:hemerythrin domain-containing protein [Actinomycetota bacterium]